MYQFVDGQFTPGVEARGFRCAAKSLPVSSDDRKPASLYHILASFFVFTLVPILLAGCGSGSASGGSGSQSQPNPTPSITSVSPTSITAGNSAITLTVNGSNFISSSEIRWNGSGLTTSYVSATQLTASIPAADIASGQNASVTVVNPAPGGGTSSAASVTVDNPTPTISSVSPASILTGSAAQNVTVNGTGFVSSSTVSFGGSSQPTTFVSSSRVTFSTTASDVASAGSQNLTVNNPTPGGGTSNSTSVTIADILVNATSPGAVMSSQQVGTNLQATFGDVTQPQFVAAFQSMGIGFIRWPGGELSDWYQGQSNTFSSCSPYGPNPSNSFDDFMQDTVAGIPSNVAITVNYGTNSTCTAGGDPAVAAAWVQYANVTNHYGIKYWTVGNEEYYPTSPDDNTLPHDPTTYANRVATLFYPQMKAVDPTIQVGVDVLGGQGCTVATGNTCGWDNIVLANAEYDFVEVHVYPENGTNDSDSYLLTQGPTQLTNTIATVQSELSAAGRPGVPIYLGEFAGSSEPDKTEISITGALFDGMVVGEVAKAGLIGATAWDGIDVCGNGGNLSTDLYGWQTFSTLGLLPEVDGNPTGNPTANLCSAFGITGLTPFPRARVLTLVSQFVHQGEHILPLQAAMSTSGLRAYAATQGSGYALMLFNLNENDTLQQTIQIQGSTTAQFSGTASTYGKAQYDESQNNVWAGPVSSPLGTLGNPFTVSLPPWSMTVVKLAP